MEAESERDRNGKRGNQTEMEAKEKKSEKKRGERVEWKLREIEIEREGEGDRKTVQSNNLIQSPYIEHNYLPR